MSLCEHNPGWCSTNKAGFWGYLPNLAAKQSQNMPHYCDHANRLRYPRHTIGLRGHTIRRQSIVRDSCLSDYVRRTEMNLGLSRFGTTQAIVSLILWPVAEVYLENPDGLSVSKPLLFRY